jgi:hypothetical protein
MIDASYIRACVLMDINDAMHLNPVGLMRAEHELGVYPAHRLWPSPAGAAVAAMHIFAFKLISLHAYHHAGIDISHVVLMGHHTFDPGW